MELSKVKDKNYHKIIGFKDGIENKIKRRILQLGIIKGEKIRVLQKSLLKKVLLLEVSGFMLSIESSFCRFIEVE